MAGRVHQVQRVGDAVLGRIGEPDGLCLDGDAAAPLDVHRIQHLLAHLALGERRSELDQPVGKRRLAVIDVGDDVEVADRARSVMAALVASAAGVPQGPPKRSSPAPALLTSRIDFRDRW